MKNIYLLCNAHIDPVWLWQRPSAMAEAVSTFRVAADFVENNEGFIFNHNEALLYEWVEKYEPELFERIKKLVKAGKWHIMGGWYLQPDCLLPTGESILRQIETGRKYFREKFGVTPVDAINFDSFGHSRGLVQILKKCGYDSYVFMRPYNTVPEHDFIWRGYDGSEIFAHNTNGGYNNIKGQALEKVKNEIKNSYSDEDILILWGVGNHGGGPSKIDLEQIEKYRKEAKADGLNIIHSTPEAYSKAVDKSGLKTYERSMVHCMVGCYTSMVRIKQLHRMLENELNTCEKMLAASGIEYDRAQLDEAVKAMLFCEFHDVLPGTMIEKAEEDSVRLLEHGREIAAQQTVSAFFELCKGQKKCRDGEIPVMVFNPNPYEIEAMVEADFNLQNQNWNDNEFTVAHVYDEQGNAVPCQNEKPDCSMSLDWMKKVVFTAKLPPMTLSRFDCQLEVITPEECREPEMLYFRNDAMEVSVSRETGFIDSLKIDGIERLCGMRLAAYRDNEDPWGMTVDSFGDMDGDFELMSSAEANEFNGYPDEERGNVRIIEDGEVRVKIQAIFKHRRSVAVVTYTIPKQGSYVDVSVDMYANDANLMYKLSFDTPFKNGSFIGQSMFGREELLKGGKEVCYQKWCGMQGENAGLAVLNRGTYGGSAQDGEMSISFMRTPIYSAHPIGTRPIAEHGRNHAHIDMGKRSFEYRLADMTDVDAEAEIFNQPPMALCFFPSGSGVKKDTAVSLDNRKILLTRYSEKGLHLLNTTAAEQKARLKLAGAVHEIQLKPFEIKAFRPENGALLECGLV